jgi:hypothetical protein
VLVERKHKNVWVQRKSSRITLKFGGTAVFTLKATKTANFPQLNLQKQLLVLMTMQFFQCCPFFGQLSSKSASYGIGSFPLIFSFFHGSSLPTLLWLEKIM